MTTNDGSSTKDTNITNTTGLIQTGTNVRPSTNTFKTKTANNETKTTNNKTKTTNIKTTTERNIETKTEPTTETSTDQNKTAKPEHDTKATQSYITMDFDPPTTMKEEQELLSAMYASACVPNTMRMSYDMVEDMLTDHIDLMEGDDLEICNKDTELISI
ncbi:MAG: hypothetical protein MSS52_09830 [Prevotella sp.]|nr:hypothetical protein [Prevotella sp.]MDY2893639.1 hypothetical protein [Prevotella sp.]MDY3787636.1 hypothetical protein [Prevotella sp.]